MACSLRAYSPSRKKGMETEAALSSASQSMWLLAHNPTDRKLRKGNDDIQLAFSFSPFQSVWDPIPWNAATYAQGKLIPQLIFPGYVLTDATKVVPH